MCMVHLMALFFLPCNVSNLLIALLPDVLSKQVFVMPTWINLLQVDLQTTVLDMTFQHQTNQEVVFLLQLPVNCVFLAQTVIFTACLMVTALNFSSPSHDLVTIVSWTVPRLFQLCLAMVSLFHKVDLWFHGTCSIHLTHLRRTLHL